MNTTPRFQKIAALVAVAVVAAGAGALATRGSQNDAAGSSPTAQGAAGAQRGGAPRAGMNLSALADKLGVSESRLSKAMAAIRPTGQAGRPPQAGQPPQGRQGPPKEMAAALAKQLGLSTSKVEAALASVRPEGVGQMR